MADANDLQNLKLANGDQKALDKGPKRWELNLEKAHKKKQEG